MIGNVLLVCFFFLFFGLFIALLHNIFLSTAFVLVIYLLTCQSGGLYISNCCTPINYLNSFTLQRKRCCLRNRSTIFFAIYLLHPYSEQSVSKPPSSPHKLAVSAVCFLLGFQENGSAPLTCQQCSSLTPQLFQRHQVYFCSVILCVQNTYVMLWKAIVIF